MQALVGGAGIPTPEVGFQSERKQDPFSRNHSVGLNILMCPAHDRCLPTGSLCFGELKGSRTDRKASWARRQKPRVLVFTGTSTCCVTLEEALSPLGLCYPIVGLDGH